MSKTIYGIALAQFFIGVLIAALNVLVLGATFVNRKLRNGSFHFLSANLWFANLLLGVTVAIANVVDQEKPIALAKTEGTIAVMNCMATLVTLLALGTSRMVNVKNTQNNLSNRAVLKILISTWIAIFLLTLVKAIVFSLDNLEYNVCYECLVGFEAALLIIFAFAAVFVYIVAMYLVCVHKKSAIHDSAAPQTPSITKEYEETITLGIWLGSFMVPFVILVVLLAIYAINPDLNLVAAEIILTLFYTHCVINPIVFIVRDAEVRATVKKLVTCKRLSDAAAGQVGGYDGIGQQDAPLAVNNNNNNNTVRLQPITNGPPSYNNVIQQQAAEVHRQGMPSAPPGTTPAGNMSNGEDLRIVST